MAWNVPAQTSPAARVRAARAVEDALGAALHLGGGAAREGQQQDAVRVGAVHHQMRDAMRQRVGLARARARDDQQRPRDRRRADAVLDRRALVGIELVQVVHANHGARAVSRHQSRFAFCSQMSAAAPRLSPWGRAAR